MNACIERTGAFDRRTLQKNASRKKFGVRIDPLVAVVNAVEVMLRPEDPEIVPGSSAKTIAEVQAEYGI